MGQRISAQLSTLISSHLVSAGKRGQLPLRAGQATFESDLAQPCGQLAIMHSGFLRPPIAIGSDVPQCWRVFVCHTHGMPDESYLIPNAEKTADYLSAVRWSP
jgi:hypothetical protein